MKEPAVDYTKHLAYSKTSEKGIQKRLARKYGAEGIPAGAQREWPAHQQRLAEIKG